MDRKWNKKFWVPILTEVAGIIVTSAGIGYEIAYHAELGFILISLGSVFIAAGGLMFSKFKPWFED